MQGKRIVWLFSFIVLTLVFSSCHRRHVADIKPAMTKAEVISVWGQTPIITYKTTSGITFETWEYHFSSSGSICRITFNQDRVTGTPQCDRSPGRTWYYAQLEGQPYRERYYDPYPYPDYYIYPYPYYFQSPYYYDGPYRYNRPHHSPHYYPYRYHHHRHRR
jgi:hypothetical protein